MVKIYVEQDPVGLELNINIHLYYASDNHIYL